MKRVYEKPMMAIEGFVPNEYVSACYSGKCDISGSVFIDKNQNGKYDNGDYYKYDNTACNHEYNITGQDATLPKRNALVSTRGKEWSAPLDIFHLFGHWEPKGDVTPAWNFDNEHTTTTLVQNSTRPNHS